MTDVPIYPLIIILYIILITNMTYEEVIWNNLEKSNKKDNNISFYFRVLYYKYYWSQNINCINR